VSVFGIRQRYRQATVPSLQTIALFSLAAAALAVVPGPAVTYIVTQSIDKGRRAGVVSALGISGGGLVHVAAATVGLSALIASSATAFTMVKLVGAAYLIVVGLRRLLTRELGSAEAAPIERVFTQGVVVNVLNPKTALFFLAFLPQFASSAGQIAFLGCLFVAIAFCSDSLYAVLSAGLAGRFRRGRTAARIRRWLSGGIFVALGVSAAAARRAS
jgi:threonine/homoserine/homoserine lactone efflux protein